jgi:cellulose synthase/poly-beta-1,6-N-acetylglucosamine synthase-like glycosyltransferase
VPAPARRRLYVSVTRKFVVAQLLAAGWLVASLAASLLLDRQPPLRRTHPTAPVTVLIAARNEAERIQETIVHVAAQDYPGPSW